MNIPIIIDTDIGSDDCMAIIALAAEKKKDIAFLLSTYGNSSLRATTKNLNTAKKLLELLPPVITGAKGPQFSSPFITDHDQTFTEYDAVFPEGTEKIILCDDYTDRLYEFISSQEKVDYIALGPLTNLALLLKKYPQVSEKINKAVIMGGGTDCGNITDFAEYNIYCDAQSAEEVFKSGIDIHLVPINVCYKSRLESSDAEIIAGSGSKFRKCVTLLLRIENEVSLKYGNPTGIIYDAVAAVYYLHPEIFTYEKTGIKVTTDGEEYGKTAKTTTRNNVTLVTGLDYSKYFEILDKAVTKEEKDYLERSQKNAAENGENQI